ncbi:hypothetical protein [Sutcliffiella horikoshii]|uniref:hypothetical protein n=1 Tax=Sutcliffiella horikoshii TaxID=79883 RepID=UPI001CFDD4A8|nr:hypothetical protein [Sutcliffiella horikoshii]
MSWKRFFITTITAYIVLSLPGIFSVGYVIDWVPGTTIFQKAKGYVVEGLIAYFLLKIPFAILVGLLASTYRRKRNVVKS